MAVALVSASDLSHSFAGKTLFKNISFGVEEKDAIGLIGPNGSGKSTLLKILAKKMEPEEGEVRWKRGLVLGYVQQSPQFSKDAQLFSELEKSLPPDATHDAKVWEWMSRLGLDRFSPEMPVRSLSGGWKKRLALGCELMKEPELLLLDEPTNHLDVDGILWLEEHLQKTRSAVLMITHDRLFLQRVSKQIFDLDRRNPQGLLKVRGDYVAYREAKEHLMQAESHREWTLKNTLRRETEWLARGAQARQTKQKARIDAAGDLKSTVQNLSLQNRQQSLDLNFESQSSIPKRLLEAKKLTLKRISKDHSGEDLGAHAGDGLGQQSSEKILFQNLDLLLGRGSRVGLLGVNGSGKSSLIRVLLGQEEPTSGYVFRSDQLQVAHFEQELSSLKPDHTLLYNLCPFGDHVQFCGRPMHVRSYMEKFLFRPEQAEQPVSRLSGGEQARLRLAQLMLQPATLLVLDEPTNDLDLETLQVLEDSLKAFEGAVLLVTHDRYFMDQVVSEILSFPEPNPSGKLERFANYFQWEQAQGTQLQSQALENSQTLSLRDQQGGTKDRENRKAQTQDTDKHQEILHGPTSKQMAATQPIKKLSQKEKLRLQFLEVEVQRLETLVRDLETAMMGAASDHQKLVELSEELGKAQLQLNSAMVEWLSLSERSC